MAKRVAGKLDPQGAELVIITGLSGSGKGTVLKAFEDLGYYSVDNLPIELIPKFAELAKDSGHVRRAALVVDIREGARWRIPGAVQKLRRRTPPRCCFSKPTTVRSRRFSETRRPHPLGTEATVPKSLRSERERLAPIRSLADPIINTTKFNVHELRETIREKFRRGRNEPSIRIHITSFGYRHGVPADSDLVFDVRFLPNPNYIPAVQEADRQASQRGALHPLVSADHGVHRPHLGSADLPAPALYSRRQELSDHRLRLHRRPSPQRDDRERNPQAAGAAGFRVKETHRDISK